MYPISNEALSEVELSTYESLKSVVTNFLENHLSTKYENYIEVLLKSYFQLRVRNVKLIFEQS